MTKTVVFLVAVSVLGGCGGGGGADAAPSDDGGGADSSPPGDGGTAGSWGAVPPLRGGPRQETGVAALGTRVYVVGGFDETQAVVDEVETFDPVGEVWDSGPPLPAPMHHANVAAVGGRLYVVGSLRTAAFVANGEVWELDPGAGEWTQRASMPAGTERGGSGVAVIGTKIYVAGGFRGLAAVADFSAYDTSTDTWEALPPLPAPRDHLVAGAVGDLVIAIGGRGGQITGHTPRVDVFDTAQGGWREGSPMPTSRGGAAAAVLDGRIYVFGGEGNGGAASGVFDDVESYDPVGDAWLVHTPMPTPRHGTGAAAVEGRIYVPGGADVQAFGAVATVEVFTP